MESFENVLFISQCRQQYYRVCGMFQYSFLMAMHNSSPRISRHHDVGKNQVGLAFIDEVERFLSVAYTFHLVGVRQAVDMNDRSGALSSTTSINGPARLSVSR